ncbi:hypothetical protein [Lentzea albida]|uniref:Uncharacterized protein n=1 Tax=Lentzea albida TaxID=65499 RepID=A0A1H9GR98_9PSEU|nr:hypothetical protein [Lentzea albida]SEQ52626.1 hypothetical protein SAMN04488000_103242 [Lentzea albida]
MATTAVSAAIGDPVTVPRNVTDVASNVGNLGDVTGVGHVGDIGDISGGLGDVNLGGVLSDLDLSL